MEQEDPPDNVPNIAPLLSEVVERIEALLYDPDGITQLSLEGISMAGRIATGFIDLDSMTNGLQPGDLIVVAGRPSMGKTAFAINIAEHVALKLEKPVAFFSMQMSGTQLAMRMIGSVGKIDQYTLRTGRLDSDDWPRMTRALERLNEAPIFIDETATLTVQELRAYALRLRRQNGGLGLIVIDYLQQMSASADGEPKPRKFEISEISRDLKALATELDVPVVVLSQLNRSLEQRKDKRPIMPDLGESGSIKDDADLILFIYRDEVYNPDSPDKGAAEIIIAKHRNGPTGTVKLTFRNKYTRFDNYADGSIEIGE